MAEKTKQKMAQKLAKKIMRYDLIRMEKELPGYWLQNVNPEFEFIERIKYSDLLQFPVHNVGVIIQKHIPEGQRYPDVRYYLLIVDEENETVELYPLSKKDVSKEMAENLKKFILKHIRLPEGVKLERVTKNGMAEFKFWASRYDQFTMKI